MFGHSALNPQEIGLIRLQPVLIISEKPEDKTYAEEFLNNEFDDYLYIINLNDLTDYDGLSDINNFDRLKEFKLHIIRIFDHTCELHLRSGQVLKYDFENIEVLIEKCGRELINYYHKMNNPKFI